METKIYTVKDLAKLLNLCEATIRKLIKDNKIKSLETKGVMLVSEYQLEQFLKGE